MSWIYGLRCLECEDDYEVNVDGVSVGPISACDYDVVGHEMIDGIRSQITKPVYQGTILRANCPRCFLRLSVASDLEDDLLLQWLEQRKDWIGEPLFDLISPLIPSLKVLPFPCPRCDLLLSEEMPHRMCRNCGNNQIQLVRSHSGDATR